MLKKFLLLLLIISAALLLTNYLTYKNMPRFENIDKTPKQNRRLKFFKWAILDRLLGRRYYDPRYPDGYNFQVVENDGQLLRSNKDKFSVTFIGHSSVLIQIDGKNILTDPDYNDHVWTRKRITKPGIAFDKLPPIDVVLISHNHYDHLDSDTIDRLGAKPSYFVPLGLKKWFSGHDIAAQEMDWWKSKYYQGLKITFVPAQHFSSRGLFDGNKTRWGGWVVEGKRESLYFAGDTGYFSGFKPIGERFPHLTAALLPIGAYEPAWFMRPMHINPQEAIYAFLDLKAEHLIPIHWGTFKMSDEPMDEPLLRLNKEAATLGISDKIWALKHGESRFR